MKEDFSPLPSVAWILPWPYIGNWHESRTTQLLTDRSKAGFFGNTWTCQRQKLRFATAKTKQSPIKGSTPCMSTHGSGPDEDQVGRARIATVHYLGDTKRYPAGETELVNIAKDILKKDPQIIRMAVLRRNSTRTQRQSKAFDSMKKYKESRINFYPWEESDACVFYVVDPSCVGGKSYADQFGALSEDNMIITHPQNRRKMAATISLLGMDAYSLDVTEESSIANGTSRPSTTTISVESHASTSTAVAATPTETRQSALASAFADQDVFGGDFAAVVLVAVCQAESTQDLRSLIRVVRNYLREMEAKKQVIWSSLMVDETKDEIITMCSFKADDMADGAYFDTCIGDEFISDAGWRVTTFASVFPDSSGWDVPFILGNAADTETEATIGTVKENAKEATTKKASRWQSQEDTSHPSPKADGPLSRKTKMVFGVGALDSIGKRINAVGKRVFVITGWNQARADSLIWELKRAQDDDLIEAFRCGAGYSSGWSGLYDTGLEDMQELADEARAWGADCIVGYGGGAVLDVAKVVGALASKGSTLEQAQNFFANVRHALLEQRRTYAPVVLPSHFEPLPVFLFPTMFGSGAEVSDAAVVRVRGASDRMRISFEFESLRDRSQQDPSESNGPAPHTDSQYPQEKNLVSPRINLLVDPRLAQKLQDPMDVAIGGMNAACMCIESILARNRTGMSIALASDGLSRAAQNIPIAIVNSKDDKAVTELLQATLYGGLARETCGLGVAASIAIHLGVRFRYRLSYILLMPALIELAVEEASYRSDSVQLQMIQSCARLVAQKEEATSRDLIEWLYRMIGALELPPFSNGILCDDARMNDLATTIVNGGGLFADSTPFYDLTAKKILVLIQRTIEATKGNRVEKVQEDEQNIDSNPMWSSASAANLDFRADYDD